MNLRQPTESVRTSSAIRVPRFPQEIQTPMPGKKCRDVMTSEITCCTLSDTAHVAAQSLKAHNVGSLPVIESHEGKRLVGIVTDRDLALKVVAEGCDPRKTTIDDVMS